jgi:hypothetical protein
MIDATTRVATALECEGITSSLMLDAQERSFVAQRRKGGKRSSYTTSQSSLGSLGIKLTPGHVITSVTAGEDSLMSASIRNSSVREPQRS